MSSSDPKREFAVGVVRTLKEAGFTALWAGGCVRDLLLEKSPDDYDVATDARPEQVQALFGPRRTRAIGVSFGVVLVHGPRRGTTEAVEVATFRTEGPYLDGRRPEHVVFATPEEDAQRRDFTINGMFIDPLTDQVLDFVGGRRDLEQKIVRAIGDPHERFREDKLRMLRAVRITARFDFDLDQQTAEAVRSMAPEILAVSHERIAQELKKMLVHPRRSRAMTLFQDLGLMTVVLPEMEPVVTTRGLAAPADRWLVTTRMLESLDNPRFELAFAAALFELAFERPPEEAADAAAVIGKRLRLSNDETDGIVWLIRHRGALAGARQFSKSRLKRLFANPQIGDLFALVRAHRGASGASLADVEFCETYMQSLSPEDINPRPLINGDDLRRLGLVPGERFKELLDRVRDAQLDELIHTREEALDFVRRIVADLR